MQKDVALDPCVGAIEIQLVVRRATEHIVDEMNDRPRPIAAREIDHVIVGDWFSEEVALENSMPAALDAAGPVHEFKTRRRVREHAILHNERGAIDVQVGT